MDSLPRTMPVHSPIADSPEPTDSLRALTALETRSIDLFFGFAGLPSLPKSIGELYGFLL
jgi:hypothetical protein